VPKISSGIPPKLLGTGITKKPRVALAFVAVWALLGIKLISGHSKNVVALNANAMDVGLWRRRSSAGHPLRTCDRSIGGFDHKRHSNMGSGNEMAASPVKSTASQKTGVGRKRVEK
jgi:hypothetical protein